jgi:cytochrome P450
VPSPRAGSRRCATPHSGYLAHLFRAGEPVDFMAAFALPVRVICALLGVPVGPSPSARAEDHGICSSTSRLRYSGPRVHIEASSRAIWSVSGRLLLAIAIS